MKKVLSYGVLFLVALSIVASCAAGAQLVGTAFGFPTILQNGATTAFNRDTAAATDTEALAIAFPTDDVADDVTDGAVTDVTGLGLDEFAFPTIAQTVDQTQVLTHTDFATTNETAAFAYPFTSVGAAGLPGLGLGFC